MSKYIIEIEDEPFGRNDDFNIPHGMDELYKAKGFNTLVFDKHGLDKLTPLDNELEETYQRGLDDAWEATKKIALMDTETSENVTGYFGLFRIMENLTPMQAIAKLKAYEEQKKADAEIEVGDEVRNTLGLMGNAVGFVIGTTIEGDYNVSRYIDGKIKTGTWRKENCVKTGKHSDAVVQLLSEMKGEQRICSTCKYSDGSDVPKCSDCFFSFPKGYNMWEPKEGAE